MSIIGITEVIKTSEGKTLYPVEGKVQRIINNSSEPVSIICANSVEGDTAYTIDPGKFKNFWYDGTTWWCDDDSLGELTTDFIGFKSETTAFENKINNLFSETTISTSAVTDIDWGTSVKYRLNLSENTVLTFTDPITDTHLQLLIFHGSAGSTLTFPSGRIKWAGGSVPSLTTTADKVDIISLYYSVDDNIYYGMAGLNF